MKFTVILAAEAQEDLDEAYDWLAPQTINAANWYNRLLDALLSLETMPEQWPLYPDPREAEFQTRQMIYGEKRHGYRVLFEIRGNNVYVLRILHGARGS